MWLRIVAVCVGSVALAPSLVGQELPDSVRVERVELARLAPEMVKSRRLRISRDFEVVVVTEDVEGGKRLVCNGQAGPAYARVEEVGFGPVGHRWLCVVEPAADQALVVVDGVAGAHYAEVDRARWSADGQHYALAARRADGAWAVVVDGREGEFMAGRVQVLAVSPDGAHVACVREESGAQVAYLDGQRIAAEATRFPHAPFAWSGDGSTFALIYEMDDEGEAVGVLVVGGVERGRGRRFDPDYLSLSADGRHFAVSKAGLDGHYYVLHGERTYGPYGNVWGRPQLTASGTQVAFVATTADDRAHVVIDGVVGPAAINRWGAKSLAHGNGGWAYLRESAEGAYAVHVGERVVADGVVGAKDLWVSPDGARTAWLAGKRMVIDGREEPEFSEVATSGAGWSPDGQLFAYLATRDRKSFTVRLGGIGERTYELASPLFLFPAPGAVRFVSYEGGALYRETWTVRR